MQTHKCIMINDIKEIKADVKRLLAFKFTVVGIAIICGIIAGMVCFNIEVIAR